MYYQPIFESVMINAFFIHRSMKLSLVIITLVASASVRLSVGAKLPQDIVIIPPAVSPTQVVPPPPPAGGGGTPPPTVLPATSGGRAGMGARSGSARPKRPAVILGKALHPGDVSFCF